MRNAPRHVSALLGFRWGYLLHASRATLLPAEPLSADVWNLRVSFLRQAYPTWRLAPDFAA